MGLKPFVVMSLGLKLSIHLVNLGTCDSFASCKRWEQSKSDRPVTSSNGILRMISLASCVGGGFNFLGFGGGGGGRKDGGS